MLFAAEGGEGTATGAAAEAVAHTSGWFLEHAWLIPVGPLVAFFLILFFGKRTRKYSSSGAYFGIASMLWALVLSAGAAFQWIQRVRDAEGGETLHAIGRAVFRRAEEGGGHEVLPAVEPVIKTFTWWQSGGFKFTIGTHIDGLAIVLLVVVAFISTLVQIYSLEYLRGDRRYTHFFAALTLFSGAMLAMVSADNMLYFLLGWEIMGLCSFMLIGHWWEEYPNARAALKAFFTVRTGDVGLLIGICIVFFSSHEWITENLPGQSGFSIHAIGTWALSGEASHTALLVASISLFIAAIGKSGQFPLHTWLPDAMAGPTPVSSLLHSSTMVVAGVFLVARLYPVFYEGFSIGTSSVNFIVVIAAITIIISGLLAMVQHDIKKVLAYSTVGQLGYMMLGLGVGAWTPAVFHIFTHAFFKACLFLGAGSVSHSGSHHSFDMKKDMGGLAKKMPITAGTFIVSTIALAGVPPLAGFWSKDEILANAGYHGYTTFMVIGFIGAAFTATYMGRCVYLTFFGEPRGAAAGEHHDAGDDAHADDAHDAHSAHDTHAADAHGAHDTGHGNAHGDAHGDHGPHESPPLITVPLVILSVLAVVAGWINMPWGPFKEKFIEWFEPRHAAGYFPELTHAAFSWSKAGLSLVIGLGFLLFGAFVYKVDFGGLKGLTERNKAAKAGYSFLWNKYYLDSLYEKVIVAGIAGPIARAAYWINQNVLDGIVNGVGIGSREAGRWVYRNIDQKVVDGVVNGSGVGARESGGFLRTLQTGKVQQYGALLFGAATIAALALVIFVRS
ncbi:MAG: NADH-quinone oxidoreductase subunit L [Acidimicrobiia bacterium]